MIFPSLTIWHIDGQDISEITTSQWPSRFSSSGKQFVKQQSVLSGKSFADAIETNSIVNPSFVKWLWSTTLFEKITADSHVLFILLCVCCRFVERNCSNFKNFPSKMWLITLPEVQVKLGDANSVSNLKLEFSTFCGGLLYRLDKLGFLEIFGIKYIEQIFLETSVVTNWDTFRMYLYPYSSIYW